MKEMKPKSRLALFVLLTVFSLLLLGAAEVDSQAQPKTDNGNQGRNHKSSEMQ